MTDLKTKRPIVRGATAAVSQQATICNEGFMLRSDGRVKSISTMTFRKGAFFRLSDFVNEYDFPNYSCPEGNSL